MAIRRISFSLGRVVATPGALQALDGAGIATDDLLLRHARGDWGDICKGDWKLNDSAAKNGCRILSAYNVTPDLKVWIITEADRSSTCLLLPEEY